MPPSKARTVVVSTLPEGDGHAVLRQRGQDFDLVLGNVVLLSSAALETELAFGRLARELYGEGGAPRFIVGGLGFGATLRGVLDVAPADGEITVVDKLRCLPELLRGPLAHLPHEPARCLKDPRVRTVVGDGGDVAEVIASAQDASALLLDVDNGPHWASFRGNARLYGEAGLAAAYRCLVPGGALAVWSGYPADAFVPRLRAAGFLPRIVPMEERGVVRARAYVGVRPPSR